MAGSLSLEVIMKKMLFSILLGLAVSTTANASVHQSSNRDEGSPQSRSSQSEERWLILGKIKDVKPLDDGLSDDGNTMRPALWAVELDDISVVTGPKKDYSGPSVVQIAASHVEEGAPDTYFNVAVSSGRARALNWGRVSKVACFESSVRDSAYDKFYLRSGTDGVCIGVDRYLGDFVDSADEAVDADAEPAQHPKDDIDLRTDG